MSAVAVVLVTLGSLLGGNAWAQDTEAATPAPGAAGPTQSPDAAANEATANDKPPHAEPSPVKEQVTRAEGRASGAALKTTTPPDARGAKPQDKALPGNAPKAPCEDDTTFSDRTLKGHAFLFPLRSDNAFVTSHLTFAQGVSYENVRLESGPEFVDLGFAGAVERLDIGIRFHERIGFFGGVDARIAAGIDPLTAFYFGADASVSWRAGAAGMILRSERTGTQLGARLSAQGALDQQVTPFQLVDALIATSEQEEITRADLDRLIPSLFSRTKSIGGRGSVNLAQALGRHFSAQASLDVDIMSASRLTHSGAQEVVYTTSSTALGAGIALTMDGMPYAPVALLAEYRLDATVASWTDGPEIEGVPPMHAIVGGIYYTGRRYAQIGVVVSTLIDASMDVAPDVKLTRTSIYGQFTIRTFF
ncbi:hypothetical protein [Chondromyces apiculatus]|uniref:hypothetical protein n=1 Tax=Chondromyces apiculatus TaxID=51 RepID=UPI0012DE0769|nr:hypothetical protein [Chondromyces apiculatus]